jgi:colanic acid/amylovoran biosynthesis glycosyltransferase
LTPDDAGQASRMNGVDMSELRGPVAQRNLLCVSRLARGTGVETLVTAFGMLADDRPTVDLEIIGDGPLENELRARARALGLEYRVRFRGQRPSADVREAMRRCALLVLPCRVDEFGNAHALPTVLVEAMSVGTPVVTTTVAGLPELLHHDATGLLVPPDDPAALAVAIDSLLEDPARAAEIGDGGRRLVAQIHDREERSARVHRVGQEVHG